MQIAPDSTVARNPGKKHTGLLILAGLFAVMQVETNRIFNIDLVLLHQGARRLGGNHRVKDKKTN